jgi:hypothetical protein
LAFALSACESGPERPRPPEGPPPKPAAKPPLKKPVVEVPRWPSPSQIDERARALLSSTARDEITRSPVPALVPHDARLLSDAVVTTGPHWYAVSAKGDGISVALHGTRLAHDYRDIPPARGRSRVRGQDAFITQNEHVWSASWLEHGVAYSLEVECASRGDERCQDDGFLVKLSSELVFVGGEGSMR